MAAYDGSDYDGIRLGSRPGEFEGEDSFGAYASQELDDDFGDAFHDDEELQLEENRTYRGGVVKSANLSDDIGDMKIPEAMLDHITGEKRISYSSHANLVRDKAHNLSYDANKYKLFDWEISDYLKDDRRHEAIDNASNQYYKAYEPLRQNVAILRNALYTQYFPDGEYNASDPNDVAKVIKIKEISQKIGHELKWQSRFQWVYNVATLNFSESDLSIKRFGKYGEKDSGAQDLYKMLYNKQESLNLNPIKWMMGKANRYDWELPPPEESVFSQRDMKQIEFNDEREGEMGIENCGPTLCMKALATEGIAAKLKTGLVTENIQAMNGEQREESVELGREILRKLRDITASRSKRVHEGVDHKRQDLERANLANGLAENYLHLYQDLLKRDPSIGQDSTFERARIALGKLGHFSMLHALDNSSPEERKELQAAYNQLPQEYKKISQDNEADLIRDVEVAMEEMSRLQGVGHRAAPEVKSYAQAAVKNLHNTMSNPRIGAASANIVDKAAEVGKLNEGRQAKVVEMNNSQNLGSQHRA